MSPSPPVDVMFSDGALAVAQGGICMCVCGLGGNRGEEDEGDPICLFCPPDVSESRLRDLARGVAAVVAQEGLKLLTHLHPWLLNTHTN